MCIFQGNNNSQDSLVNEHVKKPKKEHKESKPAKGVTLDMGKALVDSSDELEKYADQHKTKVKRGE